MEKFWIGYLLSTLGLVAYFVVRAGVIAGGATWILERTRIGRTRRVFQVPYPRAQLRSELKAAAVIVVSDALVGSATYAGGMVKPSPATPFNVAFTFALLFVWAEVWFYFTHRWMHQPRWYFLHAQHHVAKVTHPLTSLSFSIVERLILQLGVMGMLVAASPFLPIAPMGVFLYFFFNYSANVFGHMNVELLPASWARSPWRHFFNSPSYHALHHARYNGHYSLFVPALDRLFGTSFADYAEVHERAASGRGLTRLTERGQSRPADEAGGLSAAAGAPAAT